jgi:hypothetical protein
MDAEAPLERLEAASREVEALAIQVAAGATARGDAPASRTRVRLIQERLRLAADQLDEAAAGGDAITDE